jgi:hypothetical protein
MKLGGERKISRLTTRSVQKMCAFYVCVNKLLGKLKVSKFYFFKLECCMRLDHTHIPHRLIAEY